ncbi:MFS transporter [Gluconacetobacter azotocaptans]|uniref:MDR family MFS transporter n=1 Tax=Gluconacetobacter azotocaptans TaxID=142834 RepID=UPI001957D182|nr:MDR family MFS transporter [Gluconacetobacter azotocaptans]MBM9401516.1 MFS transporter [Gluconacetobacter azotocaptans]
MTATSQQPGDAAPDDTPTDPDAPTRAEIRAVVRGLMIVLALGALDQSIVATALPRIVGDLGGVTHMSWIVSAYVLASTSVMPLYGKLADQYGRKPVLTGSVLAFLLGSVLCGAAHSLPQMILFRAIQGLGAGGLMPLTQIIIGDLVPVARRGRRQGMVASVFALCSILGPIAGGVVTDLLSWHWIFYLNLPIGTAALLVITRALRRFHHPVRARRIDYPGALLMSAATTAFLLVLTLGGVEWPWASLPTAGLAAAALLLLFLFVRHIRRVPEPVLPPGLFHDRLFVVASLVLALAFMGLMGAGLFFPLFFQRVMGVSPSHSGFLTGPLMIGVVVSSVINGRVLLRSGRYKPAQIGGLTLALAAFAILGWASATARGLGVIEPAMMALGLGLGLITPNMTIAVQNALPVAHRGVGTATLAFFRSLGGLAGVAGAGVILAWSVPPSVGSGQDPAAMIALYRHAIATTFLVGAAVIALSLVAILFLPERPLATGRTPSPDSGTDPQAPRTSRSA